MKLYEKQQQIVDEINERITDSQDLSKGHIYLSGEMGCGKTYMGTQIAHDMVAKGYPVLVVSPKVNIGKWDSLLDNAKKMKKKDDYAYDDITLMAFEDLNMWTQVQTVFNEDIFVIIDEVHLATNTRYQAFNVLLHDLTTDNTKGLYLTGTIMEGERKQIAKLLELTHEHYKTETSIVDLLMHNFPRFIYDVWSEISISISLEDVQELEENREEIKQDIAPIKPIPLTMEQDLFSDVISEQLRRIEIPRERIYPITTSFIDNPTKPLVYKKQSRPSKERLKEGSIVRLAIPLKEFKLKETSKYKSLKDSIENSNDDKILVYVNDETLIQQLKSQLEEDGITTFTINDVKPENYSEHINQQFQSCKVGIVDPEKVNVGIDIHAEQLVWYQLMPKLDKMIQAQRRVCRLSSKSKSLVTIMVYDTHYENDRAKQLSEATKNNALTYGVKQKDALAQLTGILLDGIN